MIARTRSMFALGTFVLASIALAPLTGCVAHSDPAPPFEDLGNDASPHEPATKKTPSHGSGNGGGTTSPKPAHHDGGANDDGGGLDDPDADVDAEDIATF